MVTLLFFSLYYYRLRMFSDTAGCVTDIIRKDGFTMAHSRFIAIINQLLPVALLKAHASLKAIAIAYSFNHTLVPVVLALLCMHWLKRPYHALAMMLQAVLMSVLLFYYPISELQMGLFLLLFYDALADDAAERGRRTAFLTGTLILLPVIAFSHPMMLLVCAGWLCYRFLKDRTDYLNTGIAALVLVAAFCVKKFWFTSNYEVDKTITWEKFRHFRFQYYQDPFALSIYRYVLNDAFLVLFVLLCSMALLIWMKKYRLLGLLIAMVIGIITLLLLNFEDGWSYHYDHYNEHLVQPVVFFIVLFFCYTLPKVPGNIHLKTGIVALILMISLVKIYGGRESHIARQKWIYSYLALMDRLQVKKAVLGRNWVPESMVQGTFWSANWESLILSSLDGPERSKTLFMAWYVDKVSEPVWSPNHFVTDGGGYRQNTLPERYFVLGDKPYVFLEKVVPHMVLERLRWP